jgi:hypothetical protein
MGNDGRHLVCDDSCRQTDMGAVWALQLPEGHTEVTVLREWTTPE